MGSFSIYVWEMCERLIRSTILNREKQTITSNEKNNLFYFYFLYIDE